MKRGDLSRLLRRFRNDETGAHAIEFAFLAPIFLALTLSVLEAGWIMARTTMLDRAVDLTARQIRIAPSTTVFDQNSVRKMICDKTMIISDCTNALLVEMIPIQTASDFPQDEARCVNRGTSVKPATRFTSADRSQVVFMRSCVVVDVLTPFIGLGLALPKDATGGFQMVSTTVFMSEPA